jgi:hypothetical protein
MDFLTQLKKKVHGLLLHPSEETRTIIFATVVATSPIIVFIAALFLFVGWQLHIHALELGALIGFLYVISVLSYVCDKLFRMWGDHNKDTRTFLRDFHDLIARDNELIQAHRNLRREYVTLANRYHDLVELYEENQRE